MTTVYIPIYTNHWDVITDDGDLLKPLYKSSIFAKGGYTNKEAAWNYIHKNYGAIKEEDYFFGKEFR